MQRRELALASILCLLGCRGANDTVLQPDTVAGTGSAGRAGTPAAGGGGGPGAGTGAPASGTGGSTGAAGKAGASGTTGAAGKAGAGGAAANGGATAGAAGTAAGTGGMPESGTGGAGMAGASGMGGEAGMGEAGTGGATGASDPDCDFNGIWIGKQVTVSEALTLPQSSNNWYYLEFKQTGDAVEVSKHFDCGIEVRGSATVKLLRTTLTALIGHNVQTGRKGTLKKDGNRCSFEAARFWSIRGADEARFLPNATRDSGDSIDQVAAAKPLPTKTMTDGAVDTENDGKLGVAFQVTGIIGGTRNSVQRDWTRWFTETGYEITPSMNWTTDLKVRADFDNEESIIDPVDGPLISSSAPVTAAKHFLKLRFLGRDASDARVQAIVKATDVDTCFAIQDALPAEQL